MNSPLNVLKFPFYSNFWNLVVPILKPNQVKYWLLLNSYIILVLNVKSSYFPWNQIQGHQISNLLKSIWWIRDKARFLNCIKLQIQCASHYSTLTMVLIKEIRKLLKCPKMKIFMKCYFYIKYLLQPSLPLPPLLKSPLLLSHSEKKKSLPGLHRTSKHTAYRKTLGTNYLSLQFH